MKEHFQDFGVRKWAGDDLIELQAEPLAALQTLVAPYAPCILQGCEMETVSDGSGGTTYRLHAGLAALKGVDVAGNPCVKIVRVEEEPWTSDTVYLSLKCEQKSRTYADGNNKVIVNEYKADLSSIQSDGALKISATGGAPRLVDMLGITQKLNAVDGNAKDVMVTFAESMEDARPELKSGSSLGLLLQQIRKWFDELKDLKALAFKDKVAESDLETALSGKVNAKLDRVDGEAKDVVVTFTEATTRSALATGSKLGVLFGLVKKWCSDLRAMAFKDKVAESDLETALSGKVNAKLNTVGGEAKDVVVTFVETGNQDEPEDLKSGLSLGVLISRIKKWLGKKVDKEDGYGLSQANFTPTEKLKLKDIENNANNYVHPTYPPKSSGLYKITVDESGHVSGVEVVKKSDITALGIPEKNTDTVYVHPELNHIPSGGKSGQYLKYSAPGVAAWASIQPYTHPSYTSRSSGLYKITVDSQGHVSDVTAVTKADITALGIPGQDTNTTYGVASTTSAGLMSAADRVKLNNIADVTITISGSKLKFTWKAPGSDFTYMATIGQ